MMLLVMLVLVLVLMLVLVLALVDLCFGGRRSGTGGHFDRNVCVNELLALNGSACLQGKSDLHLQQDEVHMIGDGVSPAQLHHPCQ